MACFDELSSQRYLPPPFQSRQYDPQSPALVYVLLHDWCQGAAQGVDPDRVLSQVGSEDRRERRLISVYLGSYGRVVGVWVRGSRDGVQGEHVSRSMVLPFYAPLVGSPSRSTRVISCFFVYTPLVRAIIVFVVVACLCVCRTGCKFP